MSGIEKGKEKRKSVKLPRTDLSVTHTLMLPRPCSLHLLSVPCCQFLFFSLQLSDKTLSSNMLPDLIPSKIFSKGTVGRKAQGFMVTSRFFTHPIRNSSNSSRNVYSSNRCYSQYYNFFFQIITQMLAHSLRKAHIKIVFIFYFKVLKAAAKRQGVVLAG